MHDPNDTIVLVEDDEQVSRSLVLVLSAAFPGRRIEKFTAGRPAVAFCQHHAVSLLLTDLGLPDLHGLDVIRQVRGSGQVAHVIVMTGTPTDDLPRELWDLGVAGFVDKTSLHVHIVAAVERVLAGGMYFSAQVVPSQLTPDLGPVSPVAVTELSARERDVARHVAAGLLTKEIAAQLCLSPRTVEKHRANVMHKVGVRSVPQLVYWCLRHGLV